MKLKESKKQRGFTLVELIVVIMIIGILAATLLPKVMGAPARARDAGRIADLNSIASALQSYYADNEEYPDAVAAGPNGGECLDPTVAASAAIALTGGGYISLSGFPEDPTGTTTAGQQCTAGLAGKYYYRPLINDEIANNGFMLIADVELTGNANSASAGADQTEDVTDSDNDTVAEVNTAISNGVAGATANTPEEEIYTLLGGI